MLTPVSIPTSSRLPIEHLSASFNSVTNSYKFYWFLSLLDYIQKTPSPIIPIEHLLAHMVAHVWYPTNYFRLSFGKQDRLSAVAQDIKSEINLSSNASKNEVIQSTSVYMSGKSKLAREINSLGDYVPYRFLHPFFGTQLRGQPDWKKNDLIKHLAEQSFQNTTGLCLYRFNTPQNAIEIHPLWFDYLQTHLAIVKSFCLWHLLNYLQKNNPNVPAIATKLFEPEQRNLRESRKFWQRAFEKLGTIQCIYSGQMMQKTSFSLDHFLPWSFVTHDLMWNIIPTPKNVNSAKNDQLPHFTLYFESFARLQYEAFQAVVSPKQESLLEDYALLFKKQSVVEVQALRFEEFKTVMRDTIAPQMQIARNMGFIADWSYTIL
ncbi:MAG: HNH endonuclease domain-containing protein [Candidatus Promineifilaceae bacterium]